MTAEFKDTWSRLLIARNKPSAAPLFAAEYRFEVLELLVKAFKKNFQNDNEKDLLALAAERSGKLRLTYAQIVGSAAPYLDPDASSTRPRTWHAALPEGLLVLVTTELLSVAELQAKGESAPQELESDWTNLGSLLSILDREIDGLKNKDAPWGGNWSESLRATLMLPDTPSELPHVHAWVTVAVSDDNDVNQGCWLVPAFRAAGAKEAVASIATPAKPTGFAPEPGWKATVMLDDPRTLTPTSEVRRFLDRGRTDVSIQVSPFEADELTWAARLLGRYRLSPDDPRSLSLWDSALDLDAPFEKEETEDWDFKRKVFDRRLGDLISVASPGFDQATRGILVAACWARRLHDIAAHGLTSSAAGTTTSIRPLKDVEAPASGQQLLPDTDSEADQRPLPPEPRKLLDPLLGALYLAIRLGVSAASARSLSTSREDAAADVAGLLLPPEVVYVGVARKLKQQLRTNEPVVAAEVVRAWVYGANAPNAKPWRPLVGLDVITLCDLTPHLVQRDTEAGKDEVADIDVPEDGGGLAKLRGNQLALVKKLAAVYANPPVGGLPAFITKLVTEKVSESAAVPELGHVQPVSQLLSMDVPAGLRRLLARGFDDVENLLRRLTQQAIAAGVTLRGARDIVRLGRGAFIARFDNKELSLEPALLSRIYSRAWSKTNARAQFIAATRSSEVPNGAGPSPDQDDNAKSDDFPDLAHLFGFSDLPTCTWGDSIHGPAAYLADILEFLRHRRLVSTSGKEDSSRSALSLLLDRRPDLAEIDLSDRNATVEMPFIDVVNEVLEQQLLDVSAFRVLGRFDWSPKEGTPLPSHLLQSLQTALQPWGLHLLDPVTASRVPERTEEPGCVNEEWVVRDRTGVAIRMWRHVRKNGRPESWQARLMPQTTLTASELAAEPQFVERAAYERLSSVTAPGSYSLPWSLGEAQIRELLALVDVEIPPLLACVRPNFELEHDRDWFPRALADLGISQAEGRATIFGSAKDNLLLDVERDKPGEYHLSDFLQRSGLGFEEASELEQAHAMRRTGFRLIAFKADPCSADATKIGITWSADDGPSQTAKFLRLRKRLGWSIAEMDLAHESPNIGKAEFNAGFARRLSQVRQLGQVLRLPTQDTLRIFTRLRTTALRHATASEWASVFLDRRVNGADAPRDAEALELLRTLASPQGRGTTIEELLARSSHDRAPQLERRLLAMLGAVMRLPPQDLDILTSCRHGATVSWRNLDSEKLAQLYGASVLQRALGVAPKALCALLAMFKGSPFTDPGLALELVDFKNQLDGAGLDAEALQICLAPPAGATTNDDAGAAGYSPTTIVDRVLSLYEALRAVEVPGSVALLSAAAPDAEQPPKEWNKYLEKAGTPVTVQSTWAERLNLLREPVRRQLPRIMADVVELRAEQVGSFPLGAPKGCAPVPRLLADQLEALAALLDKPLPEGLQPGPLDPDENPPRVEPGVDLLHPDVARWIVEVFGPVLQWAGLGREEILVRLSHWLEDTTSAVGARATHRGSFPSEPEVAAQLASYLLCHPLERHAIRADRQAGLAARLSQSLSTTPEHAWTLLAATPSAAGDKLSAAEWWLQLKVEQTTGPWQGPASLAIEQMDTDESLRKAFGQVKTISLFWRAVSGMKVDDVTFTWLNEPAADREGQSRGKRLKLLTPGDLLEAEPTKPSERDIVELASRWRRLAAWSRVFQATPDVVAVDGSVTPISIRRNVLDVSLAKHEPLEFNDDEWGQVASAVKRLFGLSSPDATGLLRQLGPHALREPRAYAWLREVDGLLLGTGLSATELTGVAAAFSSSDEVERLDRCGTLRASLRRRFTDSTWPEAIRKGQDRLREQKRDALVDALLNRREEAWSALERSKDRLYECLLLDTQMAACMTTSRIVQAHAAVQQFALRCTMGLETGWQIPASELVDWGQWKWMGTYRVWEACRKIFLYPENWMEPEIRDDKSRFFEELESDLNQGELTNDNAELAFTRYLHKLHDVSRLSVVATYYEFDPNEPVMHVFGRTLSQPFRYFYRQWVDERRWTPWEPVDLEIESNHIVLFKRGGRLYLGWLTAVHEESRPELPREFKTTEKAKGEYTVEGVKEPTVRWKLQLATSQRSKEGWQSKSMSPGHLLWPRNAAPTMSELARTYGIERLQLVFQDFEVPEILVTCFPQDGDPPIVQSSASRELIGSFSLASCVGLARPEPLSDDRFAHLSIYPTVPAVQPEGSRYLERQGREASLRLAEGSGPGSVVDSVDSILTDPPDGVDPTPGRFAVTLAGQASLLDALVATARATLVPSSTPLPMTMGLGLPIFYSDDAVDILVRTNFGAEAKPTSTRHIARALGGLREAVLSEPVQAKVWSASSRDKRNDDWARDVVSAIEKASPTTTVDTLLTLLETVTSPYFSDSPFELAARTHHPLACELVTRAEGRGIASVFSGRVQDMKREEVYRGRTQTQLSPVAIDRLPLYALSFDQGHDAYACYNWEAFYHAPFAIAMKFAAEGKFEDAVRWFNYIFDPIGVDDAVAAPNAKQQRQFWRTQPFRAAPDGTRKAHNVEVLLDPNRWGSEVLEEALQDLVESVMAWRRKPNLPFQVARGRWVSFQKAVVYRYIDTLIAWADARFRVDTREEITAASQLYVLAARLLGRRPRTDISMCDRGASHERGTKNYEQLQEVIDRRDDKLSEYLDTLFGEVDDILDCTENEEPDSPHLNFYNEYFCIPHNEKLFELWDRVADRLFKVRNCLNIDGVFRSLSLFAPPIDPALLARAGAAGVSFDQIMAGLNQPRAHYRFSVMLQKANEVAVELRTLGGELLQALEKRDAEEMAVLRSRLDLQAIRLNKDIRDEQIREAKTQLEAIAAQIGTVKARQTWYLERIAKGTSAKELESIEGIRSGLLVRTRVAAMKSTAAIASMIPEFTVGANGAFGSPHFALKISGQHVAFAQNFFADKLAVEGDKDQTAAGITSTLASYERRLEDWQFQRDMATGELANLEKQRVAAEIRLTIAMAEKHNLERSIESAETTDTFLKSKFTNAGLYDWMVRQVSAVYYKTYQLAAEYARAAEDCLNRELPTSQSGVKVVRSDHWQGLRKGLLAATSLIHDLKRLEAEHIKRNKRVPELMKHVSLAIVDPLQLLQLRATGHCTFTIPEVLFEMDHPGQHMRRIKSVALSVPCVTSPYAGVSCRLSLVGSAIRKGKDVERTSGPAEAIFTSTGNNDNGLWEQNLRDERYLPFEGAGAINSEWRLDLPNKFRLFDYSTISDVVLHIRYTAEPGPYPGKEDEDLADKLEEASKVNGLWAYSSLRADLADQFAALAREGGGQPVRLKLPRELARWNGQPLRPTGMMKLAIWGEGNAAPSVILNGETVVGVKLLNDKARYWLAPINFKDPESILDEAGFELSIRGLSELRDVAIFVAGMVKH